MINYKIINCDCLEWMKRQDDAIFARTESR